MSVAELVGVPSRLLWGNITMGSHQDLSAPHPLIRPEPRRLPSACSCPKASTLSRTPAHLAATRGHLECLRLLPALGARDTLSAVDKQVACVSVHVYVRVPAHVYIPVHTAHAYIIAICCRWVGQTLVDAHAYTNAYTPIYLCTGEDPSALGATWQSHGVPVAAACAWCTSPC